MEPEVSNMITMNRSQNPILMGMDMKELSKWQRRREMEEMRKQRIFNTKNRTIGVDVSTLEKQVQEKINQERQEQLENEKQCLLANRLALKAIEVAEFKEKEKRNVLEGINNFRIIHQKKEFGRDYDLEKPLNLKESKIGGDDSRWGVTVFEGEDDGLKERTKRQRDQQKAWLAQQMKEKMYQAQVIEEADRRHDIAIIEKDVRSVQLERLERACRLKMDSSIAEYNAALAEQKRHDNEQHRRKEAEWNAQEIMNTITSDFMQENPILAKSSLGPARINPMMYKKMPDEMVEEIREIQKQQIQERQERKIKEKYEHRSWDTYNDFVSNTLVNAERELNQKLKNQSMEHESYNQLLGRRQRENLKYVDDVVYSNKITDDFFHQFNKTSR